MTTFKDAIRQIFPDCEFMDEAPPTDETRIGKRIEGAYTALVGSLAKSPNHHLAKLGRTLWDIVHHRHVHLGMYDVPVLSFTVIGRKGGKSQAFLLAPPGWIDLLTNQPLMGVGSVIFTGSQAIDYYNNRLASEGAKWVEARAFAYEAEFLREFRDHTLNEYQKAVMRAHPEGLTMKYAYDYRPVAPEPS